MPKVKIEKRKPGRPRRDPERGLCNVGHRVMLYPDQLAKLNDMADQFCAVGNKELGNVSGLIRFCIEHGFDKLVDAMIESQAKYEAIRAVEIAEGARVAGELIGDMI